MQQEEESEDPSEPFEPEMVDAEVLDAYAGRYDLEAAPGTILEVSRDDDRLRMQAPGQETAELAATSDSTFTIQGVDASVTFHRDADGAVDRLTLHQNGNHVATRLADASPVDLDEYVGEYFSEELETFYTVAVDDGELVLRQRRFGTVTLSHTQDDEFGGGFPVSTVDFERDGSGQVTGLRAGNARARDIWFEKQD